MFSNKNKGFTLIELLVVIAIIGILSSVVLASLNSARKKSRDARRVSDIKQLQLALEMYYDSNGSYPTSTAALVSDYIPAEPTDPSNGNSYGYSTTTDGYLLGAGLETDHNALDSDVDSGTAGTMSCADGTSAPYGYCVKP